MHIIKLILVHLNHGALGRLKDPYVIPQVSGGMAKRVERYEWWLSIQTQARQELRSRAENP